MLIFAYINDITSPMDKKLIRIALFTIIMALVLFAIIFTPNSDNYVMSDYGIIPDTEENVSARVSKALAEIRKESEGKDVVINFEPGTYHFYPEGAAEREYYISNHDQDNPKRVGIAIEDFNGITIEGNGAEFIFHGIMLPVSVLRSENVVLKDFSIDFANPTIAQIKIEKSDEKGITFRPASWVRHRISADGLFEYYDDEWAIRPSTGIAFEGDTKHVVYQTSDLVYSTKGVTEVDDGLYHAPGWIDSRLVPGTVVAMRDYARPTPGVFLSHNKNTAVNNVKVHYAYGMGLLAQLCEDISLDGFSVCLKGNDDPRYFTTQADATHFSSCKGKISSVNGLYEGMMDDAINVHGTYLKIIGKSGDNAVIGRYMHPQAWGFDWGFEGDSVQFVRSNTMEADDAVYVIKSIVPNDKDSIKGAREFKITFDRDISGIDIEGESYGIENLTWTPEVYFAHNTVRNNRARGSLFSTPKKTVVEDNVFDHTSGTAILLCGDCNGWFETGACRDVTIRNNKFINALTNMFQFTNAVISIYPEIPNLDAQHKYFHSGIRIENNEFYTFDTPLLYAKSVNGIVFKNNKVHKNNDYKPFHWNQKPILLERVINEEIDIK